MITLKPSGVTLTHDTHQYFRDSDGKKLRGITSTIIRWMFPSTYAAVPEVNMEAARQRGEAIHRAIEMIPTVGPDPNIPESVAAAEMLAERGLAIIGSEYIVTDGENISSPVDIVLLDRDGGIWLCDIKCTSQIHEPELRLQLSIYSWLFEKQNPGLSVKGCLCMWLPRETYGKPSMVSVPRTSAIDTEATVSAWLVSWDPARFTPLFTDDNMKLPQKYINVINQIATFLQTAQEAQQEADRLREGLLPIFREFGVKRFSNPRLSITYSQPSSRSTVDSAKLKKLYPDIFQQCSKITKVKDRLTIRLKDEQE